MRDQARSLIPVPVETLREVLEHMPLGLAVFDPDRRLEMWNEAVIRLLRLPRDKVVRGQTIDWFMHYWAQQGVFGQGDHDEIVAGRLARIYSGQVRRSELGSIDTFVLEVSFHLLPDGRLVCIYADVSDRKRRNRQIRDLAYNDDLTGLPNRPAFFEALHRLLDLRQVFTLAIVDLDGFKSINDRHGHAAGDRILEAVADRCRPLLGHEDVMGRIGGDEFALLLPERRGGAAGPPSLQREGCGPRVSPHTPTPYPTPPARYPGALHVPRPVQRPVPKNYWPVWHWGLKMPDRYPLLPTPIWHRTACYCRYHQYLRP